MITILTRLSVWVNTTDDGNDDDDDDDDEVGIYLKVTLQVGVDGTLWTADWDLAMKSDWIETAKHRQIKAFRARICYDSVDAFAGRIEIGQIHRRLTHKRTILRKL